mmetsp:Transcript_23715/g.42386  ORF Transcript_23715/g.42386 Transcript_23715/m.42386 type:complete len:177 (-) Transcript_23715:146-676(-)
MRNEDTTWANWVCMFQWIRPTLPETARPIEQSGEPDIEGMKIQWQLSNAFAAFIDEGRVSKSEYLAYATGFERDAKAFRADLILTIQSGFQDQRLKVTAQKAQALDDKGLDALSPPVECEKLGQTIANLRAQIGNVAVTIHHDGFNPKTYPYWFKRQLETIDISISELRVRFSDVL